MAFLASWLGYVLNFLYGFLQNYGLAIILFSILLKLVMLPLTIIQQKSMKKSAKVQEEVNKLQVRYKNDQEKLSREMVDLYKREKVSPFSGCLWSIIQLIVFLSVFYLVSSPLTYMKKIDSKVIEDYKTEMTEKGETSSYPEIKIIESKSAEDSNVYLNMNFLGLNLSKVPMQNWQDVKVLIIPLLYVLTTFINIKYTTALTNAKKDKKVKELVSGDDNDKNEEKTETVEEQMQSMQQMTNSMNYMMPILSIFIAMVAPLGLSLYWLVSNVLQLIERFTIDTITKKSSKEV